MDEVLSIDALAGEPGLIAYECPNCGYVTSILNSSQWRPIAELIVWDRVSGSVAGSPSVRLHQPRGF